MEKIMEKDSNNAIVLKKPVILDLSDNRVRLSCDIYDNGELKTLYFEVDYKYKKYLCDERSDAFIIQILPYAMLAGQDIYCETPVTETLLYNINEVLVPTLASGPKSKYRLMKIHADTDNTPIKGTEVATGISLGIDSFYTIFKTINLSYNDFKLTHLLNMRGPVSAPRFQEHNHIIEKTADSLGIPTTFIITNVRSLWKSRHSHTHIYTYLGAVYALRKLIKTYYYSTAIDLNEFTLRSPHLDADHYLLLVAHNLTTPDVNILAAGWPHRHEKIIYLSDNEIVQKNLRVCVKENLNCSVCWKCRRSLMEFDMLGVLDNYRDVFDVDYYLNNKVEYFKELHLKPNHQLVKFLHEYFSSKEPELFFQAEKLVAQERESKTLGNKQKLVKKIKKITPQPIKKVLKKILIRKK